VGHQDPATPTIMCEQIETGCIASVAISAKLGRFCRFQHERALQHGHQIDLFPYVKIHVDIARGDFEALKICETMEAEGKARYSDIPKTYDRITKAFYPMIEANDRAGLAQILRDPRTCRGQKQEA